MGFGDGMEWDGDVEVRHFKIRSVESAVSDVVV